jgi:dihydrofolate reductase
MGKIIISENISLDGVIEDPTGEEGLRPAGWFSQVTDQDRAQWSSILTEEALKASALLLGRRSDEWFATRWLTRTGEWADRLNRMPKFIVSSTLAEPAWGNATVLRGDVVSAVSKLKQEVDGDIVVYASGQLARTLIAHDLADELRLMVYPLVVGTGQRLFGETSEIKSGRLTGCRIVGTSLAFLTYELTAS